jgi:ribosomal protein L4
LKVVRPTYLNVFDILNADKMLISEKSLPMIEDWLGVKEDK